MSQVTSGLRAILSSPRFYTGFQNLLSARGSRKLLVNRYFNLKPGARVLDIGCGTANILEVLPDNVDYIGFDLSESYIEYARKKHRHRKAVFHQALVEEANASALGKFDLVLATGLLHHLNDSAARQLFQIAKMVLSEDGVLFTIDPCFVPNQAKISHWMVSRDRGQNVRTVDGYAELAKQEFASVEVTHRNDLLRIPYDHTLLQCSD